MFYSCKPGEELIIERFGRYHKTVTKPGPGLKGLFDRVAVRVSTQQMHQSINVKTLTSDGIFLGIQANVAWRICDAKKYHYGALDGASQLGVLLSMSVKQETAGMTIDQVADCRQALDRIVAEKEGMLRDTYGIELISLRQQGLDMSEESRKQLERHGINLRCAEEKDRDGKIASSAVQQGLRSDVSVRKPLRLKRPVS
ncbi:MAG: SPFH domain-containing protein [Alphaproteobacteria bacterium]